jgi:hypothetical protein
MMGTGIPVLIRLVLLRFVPVRSLAGISMLVPVMHEQVHQGTRKDKQKG